MSSVSELADVLSVEVKVCDRDFGDYRAVDGAVGARGVIAGVVRLVVLPVAWPLVQREAEDKSGMR